MLVEKVIGNINDEQFKNSNIDYVDIEWHEAFKKLHRKEGRLPEPKGSLPFALAFHLHFPWDKCLKTAALFALAM